MKISKLTIFLPLGYLLLTGSSITYELSIRLYHRATSEFAGMISFLLTMPSSLAVNFISSKCFGIRCGDSDTTFVTLLGLSALINTILLFIGLVLITSSQKQSPPHVQS